MTHAVKIAPYWLNAFLYEGKSFEIRKDDRGYLVGDKLLLQGYDENEYTGCEHVAVINFIVTHSDFPSGLKKGYIAMAITLQEDA
jgi:hypothetical protein